ncbi:hypothetical protein A3Q32_01205 [Alcanivorax sp. KX64203]|nr:hypothetical protein A3Q32_01205 [Alcanivorax sp. KX64203]
MMPDHGVESASGKNQPAWAAARQRRAGEEHRMRTVLLEAAARAFARSGYGGTSIGAIAAEAEVSRPAFYAYFASKREVFLEVVAALRDEFLAAHEFPGIDDPYELGRAATRAFLAAHAANAALLAVVDHEAEGDEEVRAMRDEMRRRPARRMAHYVERLVAEGRADPVADPELLAGVMNATFTRFARELPDEAGAFEQKVEEFTAIYLRLIGVRG